MTGWLYGPRKTREHIYHMLALMDPAEGIRRGDKREPPVH